ncbi:MAG: IclR family transcriptional regulator [Thermomicrobiales bacterium]|nr:IclR family transcriptional regulator [Thermomicrobiales bacterium]MCO5220091.1 IclR family transcriptional regulator [Thermomicrobiales bacterium]
MKTISWGDGMDGDSRVDQRLSTLDKGLTILEAIAEADAPHGLTLTELGQRLGMHRTTLLRFLVTFRARGYLERDPQTERYRLGAQVLNLASTWLAELDVREIARPFLLHTCEECGELVHLTILEGSDVVTIDRIEGRHPLSLQTGIGNRRPAYRSASGKAILAYLPEAEVARVLATGMVAVTSGTITTPDAMAHDLTCVRARGYAIDQEENFAGVCCVAAPVFDYTGRVVASISIAAPCQRTGADRLVSLGEAARDAAAGLSQQLGGAMHIQKGGDQLAANR